MGIVDFASTVAQIPTLLKLKKGMVPRPLDVPDCFGARVEATAARVGAHPAITFEGTTITWSEFNALANRYANYLKSEGVQRGDTISIVMENRIEFLALIVGLNKLGVTAGLINTNLRGKQLTHCVTVTHSSKCIFGSEVGDALNEVKGELSLDEGEDYYVVPDAADDSNDSASNWARISQTRPPVLPRRILRIPTRRLLGKLRYTFSPPVRPGYPRRRYCPIAAI